MNNTTISYERVKENANTIRNCSKTMSKIFDDVENTMKSLNSNDALVGRAGDALLAKFNSLRGRFSSYTNAVERFSNLIYHAESETERTEREIERASDELAR